MGNKGTIPSKQLILKICYLQANLQAIAGVLNFAGQFAFKPFANLRW